ncbi:MAG: hypothetical protein J5527_10340 [Treponema sp.]|nr:hypothetical protein [Treponema sp.]
MNGFLFLIYAPIIGPVAGLLVGLIVSIVNSSRESKSTTYTSSKTGKSSYSSSYPSYDYSNSYEAKLPDYGYGSMSSIESEIRAHNNRMEDLMREQNKIMIDSELRRINESIRPTLADQFDTRITNIFRNPWEGIL